jgi:hypothetical protein
LKVGEEFAKYGLELVDFFINAITPPEEVQKAIDTRSSMGAIGDLRAFTMYQAANSMAKMAEHGGGGVGSGAMGMGMGAGFGLMMPGMIQGAMQGAMQPGAAPGTTPPAAGAPQPTVPPAPPTTGGQAAAGSGAAALGAAAGAAASGTGDLGSLSFDELASSTTTDPKALVRGVAAAAGWQVAEAGDVWHVTVPVGALRKQVVNIRFGGEDREGHPIIAYSSTCGPANEKNAMTLLRYNTQMVHGAFAVEKTPAGETIVVQANQLADTADLLEVTRVVTAVAWQADKVEEKLLGSDEH